MAYVALFSRGTASLLVQNHVRYAVTGWIWDQIWNERDSSWNSSNYIELPCETLPVHGIVPSRSGWQASFIWLGIWFTSYSSIELTNVLRLQTAHTACSNIDLDVCLTKSWRHWSFCLVGIALGHWKRSGFTRFLFSNERCRRRTLMLRMRSFFFSVLSAARACSARNRSSVRRSLLWFSSSFCRDFSAYCRLQARRMFRCNSSSFCLVDAVRWRASVRRWVLWCSVSPPLSWRFLSAAKLLRAVCGSFEDDGNGLFVLATLWAGGGGEKFDTRTNVAWLFFVVAFVGL